MCKFRSHQLREHLKKITPQTINQFSCKPYKVPVDLVAKQKMLTRKTQRGKRSSVLLTQIEI